MVKKVRFSDKVEVRYMDVSLKEHAKEVKFPIGYMETRKPRKTRYSSDTISSSSCNIWWWLIPLAVVILLIFLAWKFWPKKSCSSDKSESGDSK